MRCSTRMAALLAVLVTACSPASAAYTYDVRLQADYGPKRGLGGCVSTTSGCLGSFTDLVNPIEGFRIGQLSTVDLTMVGRDGPITVTRSERATFGIAVGGDLLKAFVASEGSASVSNCIGNGCFSAVAHAYSASVFVGITDVLVGTIARELDGTDVYLHFEFPITAFGDGSSYGDVSVDLAGDRQRRTFGSLDNRVVPDYAVDSTLSFDVLARPAGSDAGSFALPFSFSAFFNSATGLGPGEIDALNSIGLDAMAPTGVSIRSQSGLLDPLLVTSAVPEPGTWTTMLVGLCCVSWLTRRSRLVAADARSNIKKLRWLQRLEPPK